MIPDIDEGSVPEGAYLAVAASLSPWERRAEASATVTSRGDRDFEVVLKSKDGRIVRMDLITRELAARTARDHRKMLAQLAAQSRPLAEAPEPSPTPPVDETPWGAGGALRFAVRLLPESEQAEWLEEQRGYLADLPTWRARWAWIFEQLAAMPHYAYTVRTGREKESA